MVTINLVSAVLRLLDEQHPGCSIEQLQFDAIVNATDLLVAVTKLGTSKYANDDVKFSLSKLNGTVKALLDSKEEQT